MIKIPKISIVTPSLNQEKFLEQTITSIVSQNYPNLEYVIMDGGSNDGSLKIIKKYSNKLKFWKSGEDEGQWDAINKGFSKTTGEIMTWLNSDDILMPGTLNLVANIFNQVKEVNWISGIPTTINQEGFIMHAGLKPAYVRMLIKLGFYHGAGLGFIMQEGTFWRRSLWERAGGKMENAELSLDYKLWKNFAKYTNLTPVFTNLAAFRLNPNRKTRNFNSYFDEIGIIFPKLFRLLFFPIRLFIHFGLRKMGATSWINYSQKDQGWYYMRGWLDGGRLFAKPKKILNGRL
jgi:glycosyltransferase involved in cell wall biosynthesis